MLVGRGVECAAVERLLLEVRESRSGALVIRGEPGIGKSALLDYAMERADDLRVLKGVGIESESELAFAALHRVLLPVLDEIDGIPEPQADALRGAFGLAPAQASDRFLIAVGVLSVLSESADEQPLLCVVDDAQWLDGASADALAFAARRLEAEGVVLLFAARDGEAPALDGLPELRLGGLEGEAAGALIAADLSPTLRDRLVESTRGNPLALIELSAALTPDQLAERELLPAPLPIGPALENAFLERVRGLPQRSQTLLLLAAADDTGDLGTVLRAARGLGVDDEALDPAEGAGLLRVGAGGLEFRHPLVRSAVYQGAPFNERRTAHRALARALLQEQDADRRAWHRAAAVTAPNDEVADELARTSERARRRSGYAAAAAALERAAELTSDEEERAGRLVAAAHSAWSAGNAQRAGVLLGQAARFAADPRLLADIDHLRGSFARALGAVAESCTILMAGSRLIAETDPPKAIEMLLDAATAAELAGDVPRLIEIGLRAQDFSHVDGYSEFARVLVAGMGSMLEGDTERGSALLRHAVELGSDDPERLLYAALAAEYLGDVTTEQALAARAVSYARTQGRVGSLPIALEVLATAEAWTGQYAAAAADATEGLRILHDTGQAASAPDFLAFLARLAAVQGHEDECRAQAADALQRATALGMGLPAAEALHALALLDLGMGRPAEAFERLHAMTGAAPGAGHPRLVHLAIGDLVEAAVLAGRADAAETALSSFEHWIEHSNAPPMRALLARCRGQLAAGDTAASHFAEALRLHAGQDRPFERARTELLLGEALRRARRRLEARAHLRAALETFERLGAVPWEERARRELRASGETARKRDPSTADELTPQELQIARFVGEGATNRQIAAQLFLSPRTIDYHLRKIFRKLDISSRAELIKLSSG
jgi:ATP/maltotriose-dependent transcriptional regulator MalT